MIVTRRWLEEFLDITKVSTEEICQTLNAIGLEVDSLQKMQVPRGVVVAKVLSCEKHPDADKLNICQVDIGTKTVQIVCGAKNVAAGQIVAAATVGADLGEGFVIKEAKLRGVDSHGMICGSNEIGLPKLNDGIWELDESLGSLELGKELADMPLINDEVIEIELTANRGDCLSLYGVARDLSSALNIPLKELDIPAVVAGELGCEIVCDTKDVSIRYQKVPASAKSSALIALRLGCVDLYDKEVYTQLLNYTTQATGVLLRGYHDSCGKVEVKKDEEDLLSLYHDGQKCSVIGVNQKDEEGKEIQLVEASYIRPEVVSKSVMGKKLEKDPLFYRSSRGSESDLSFGLGYLNKLLGESSLPSVASVPQPEYHQEISVSFSKINQFIGQEIPKDQVTSILEKLRFQLDVAGDTLHINVPTFRHDVLNEQDVIEEIVRIVGIDNIQSSPFEVVEKSRINDAYIYHEKKRSFRHKAAGAGFFEAVHYFFDNREKMLAYHLPVVDEAKDLLNPINNDLNTLRTTLLLHMLSSAEKNLKHGKDSVALFEIGAVVNANRDESMRMAFIFSGESEAPSVRNSAKPAAIDFLSFATKVRGVLGDFTIEVGKDENLLVNPYEYGRIMIAGQDVGFMARVHVDVERAHDLPATYICEVDFDALVFERTIAKEYSKFPALSRDISLLIPKEMKFAEIRDFIKESAAKEVVNFYPIDIYHDSSLGDKASLTLRFILQSFDKTLEEEEITGAMQAIVSSLQERYALEMR